ncbi:MAG: 3-deoxy-D-manno-octulosonic acid transferase [bacterium ADurb.Bin243]|nr:MAG: 3-deoxy-D-manno-octulosonic acid transferase [bacterium ADurb.Bin243]
MRILSILVYNLILYSALCAAALCSPFIAYRIFKTGKYRKSLMRRLGFIIDASPGIAPGDKTIWLHAVSVGETLATIEFQKKIKTAFPDYKLLFTVSTETGFAVACEKCKSADAVMYFPMDFHFSIYRFMARFNVKAVVLTETEVWPNFLNIMQKKGIPSFIINGRISDRSYASYLKYSFVFRPVFSLITRCLMQSKLDAERIILAGAVPERVSVAGNIKYDEITAYMSADRRAIYEKFGYAESDLIFVAGSVHPQEDRIVVDSYTAVKKTHSGLKMIIAPRKFDKIGQLYEYMDKKGVRYEKRSDLIKSGSKPAGDIMVLDTVGELVKTYAMAKAVFIGGSLVDTGGHNLLEAAVFEKPVIFGPHTHNFKEMSAGFLESGAGILVRDTDDLAREIKRLLELPETGYKELARLAANEVTRRTGAADKIILCLQSSLNFVIIMLNLIGLM